LWRVLTRACIPNAVDGIHDDMFWKDIEEVLNIRSECEEEGSTNCEDGHTELSSKGRQNLTCFVY